MGVAIADYDNDDATTCTSPLDGDHLFHNEGNGKFRDVTKSAGIQNASFGTSAAWFDFDRDGKLDLFVANYVQWSPKLDLWCSLDGATKSYCTPESYKGTRFQVISQSRRRPFRRCRRKGGRGAIPPANPLGGRGLGLQRRRLAGRLRRERHAAQQAISKQSQWHLHRGRHGGGCRVRRGGSGARGDGSGFRRL